MGPKKASAKKSTPSSRKKGASDTRAATSAATPAKKRRKPAGCCPEVICGILSDGQRSQATHKRLASQLGSLQGDKAFLGCLWDALRFPIVSNVTASADRVFALIGCVMKTDKSHSVARHLLGKCVGIIGAEDKTVRRNACELIRVCLQFFEADDADDDDITLDDVAEVLHDRLDDKVLAVRAKAAEAILRLQDPSWGARCDVSQHLLQILCQDPVAIRQEVLRRIGQQQIVPQLLCCAADEALAVRKAAYRRLVLLSPQCFTLGQRGALLSRGLNERDADLRKATSAILKSWLQFYKSDPAEMLGALDETNTSLCTQVAEAIYEVKYAKPADVKKSDLPEWDAAQAHKLISENPSPESLLMLRVIIARLKDACSDRADIYLPEMSVSSDLLKLLMETLDTALRASAQSPDYLRRLLSLMSHLLEICLLYEPDLHTEDQRGQMLQAVFQLAPVLVVDNPTSLVAPSVQVLKHFWRDREDDLRRCMVLILNTLYETMTTASTADDITTTAVDFDAERQSRLDTEKQERIEELSQESREKEEVLQKSKRRHDSPETIAEHQSALDEVNYQIATLKQEATYDSALWIRMLEYIYHSLAGERGAGVAGFEDLVEVARHCAFDHFNGFVRAKALRILAVCSVQNMTAATTYKAAFVRALHRNTYKSPDLAPKAMRAALVAMSDVFLEHGAHAFYTALHQAPVFAELPTQDLAATPRPDGTPGGSAAPATPNSGRADPAASAADQVLDILLAFAAHGESSFDGADMGFVLDEDPAAADSRRRLLRSAAVVGLAKLLACNRVVAGGAVKVLTQLLLYYTTPSLNDKSVAAKSLSDEDGTAHAMQTLSVFFTTYSYSSAQRQGFMTEAVLRAVRFMSHDAYSIMPDEHLPDGDGIEKPGKHAHALSATGSSFLAHLTDSGVLRSVQATCNAAGKPSDEGIEERRMESRHEAVARHLLLEALVEIDQGDMLIPKKFLKILGQLSLYDAEAAASLSLPQLLDEVLKGVKDRPVLQLLQKWRSALKALVAKQPKETVDIPELVAAHSVGWGIDVESLPARDVREAPASSARRPKRKRKTQVDSDDEVDFGLKLSLDTQSNASQDNDTPEERPAPKSRRKASVKVPKKPAPKAKKAQRRNIDDDDDDEQEDDLSEAFSEEL